MKIKKYRILLLGLISMFICGCTSVPKGAIAVKNFNKEKYLGKWYEIARFDFLFEKNLNNTTAEYSLMQDGRIKVVNSGYNYIKKEHKQAHGVARFRGKDDIAKLEVSFFGPFYGGYNVIAIDENYKYALVIGKQPKYLWILSREKYIPENIKTEYLTLAKSIGCKIDKLVWVEHN